MLNRILIFSFISFLLAAFILLSAAAQSRRVSTKPIRLSVELQKLTQESCFQDKEALSPHWRKVDSNVRQTLARIVRQGMRSVSTDTDLSAFSNSMVKVRKDGSLRLTLYVSQLSEQELAELRNSGYEITFNSERFLFLEGWLSFSRVEAIAQLDFVRIVQPTLSPITNTGSVNSEGDSILMADTARQNFNVSGAGIKVGVISDSVDGLGASQSSLDLPPNVEVLRHSTGKGEGTAMLEIVHDLAPGSDLAFYGPSTSGDMINGINQLAAAGSKVIVDDLTNFDQPHFEEGPIAQTINEITSQGATYVTSAGNFAMGNSSSTDQGHYESQFVGSGLTGGMFTNVHNFGGGLQEQQITVAPKMQGIVVLQWSNPFNSPTDDYDLYVLDQAGNVVAMSCNTQDGTGHPLEMAIIDNRGNDSPLTRFLVVDKHTGSDQRLELYYYNGINSIQFATAEGSIAGNANARSAITVGAINADDPGHDTIAPYSSRGPADIFFPFAESLQKPEVTGIDKVSITGAAGFKNPFGGTSAAAPHIAAIAALMLQINPTLTASEVKDLMKGTAFDLGDSGDDFIFGAGRANALAAVQSAHALKVLSIIPAQNAGHVPPATTIQVTFSGQVNTSTFSTSSFVVSGNLSGLHSGTFIFSANNTIATFAPATPFERGEVVTISISSNIRSADNWPIRSFVSQFNVSTAPSTATFTLARSYTPPISGTNDMLPADIDGDGDVDLILSNHPGSISVLKNNGDGTFQSNVDYPTADVTFTLGVADLDNDGDVDLIAGLLGGPSISILKNNGNGTFQSPATYAIRGYGGIKVCCADLDGDGDTDIATASGGWVNVLRNNGDGTFQDPTYYTVQEFSNAIIAADLNSDGKIDLAIGSSSAGLSKASILLNYGSAVFQSAVSYTLGNYTTNVIGADLDADKDIDLIQVGCCGRHDGSILRNIGDGKFGGQSEYSVWGNAILAADLDGDGSMNLAIIDPTINPVRLWVLFQYSNLPLNNAPSLLAGADLDGDGDVDLVTLENLGGSVLISIYSNGNCTYSLSPINQSFLFGGGNGSINVTTPGGCSWTALSNDPWITITLGNSGSGNGVVNYSVMTNPYPRPRIGTINIADKTFTVTQARGMGVRPSDFDGDGKTDLAIYRPSEGTWRIFNGTGNGTPVQQWGANTDILVPGDYDGDGKTDIAVYRPSEGNWYIIQSSDGAINLQNWGGSNDKPVPGDYDGDGKTDTAIFRPSEGNWYIRNSSNGMVKVQGWGNLNDKAVPGDYDGDGKTDFAVWRPSDGNWYIINSASNTVIVHSWGLTGDRPVPRDYDGDGKTDQAVFRPSEGNWYIANSSGGVIVRNWGEASDVLVPSDYDGDGKTDIAVYRPSEGNWYIIQSSTDTVILLNLGQSGDVPVPSTYIP